MVLIDFLNINFTIADHKQFVLVELDLPILHVWIFESMSKIWLLECIFIDEDVTQNFRVNLRGFVQKSIPFSSWMGILYFWRWTVNDVMLLVIMELTYRIIIVQ